MNDRVVEATGVRWRIPRRLNRRAACLTPGNNKKDSVAAVSYDEPAATTGTRYRQTMAWWKPKRYQTRPNHQRSTPRFWKFTMPWRI
jgi:hypothetical protein